MVTREVSAAESLEHHAISFGFATTRDIDEVWRSIAVLADSYSELTKANASIAGDVRRMVRMLQWAIIVVLVVAVVLSVVIGCR